MTKTIFAPATAPGKAGVAIVRISGNDALHALSVLCPKKTFKPRYASLATLLHPESKEIIDEALVLYFSAPHSFTGEDVVELHLHGSFAVMNTLMETLAQFQNFQIAEPGEFSRRAFANSKMDLTEAEGLADLIDAETRIQQQQALRQMRGELHHLYDQWRHAIISLLANMEAYIDFPDEELPQSLRDTIMGQVTLFKQSISEHLDDNQRGEKLRSGFYATILGAPNVGKSSLINYLAKRDIAIVSNIAGTTRDVIEVHLDIGGYPVIVADTAGLRESGEAIEEEGIRRARQRAEDADLKIAIFDATSLPALDKETLSLIDENTLVVLNKADQIQDLSITPINGQTPIILSLVTQQGVKDLLDAMQQFIASRIHISTNPVITRTRHRVLLQEALSHLDRFTPDNAIELAAEDLRMAARSLGKITGYIDIEEILDEIFRSFCIGK